MTSRIGWPWALAIILSSPTMLPAADIDSAFADLKSTDRTLQLAALESLAARGSAAEPAIPYLLQLLDSEDLVLAANASNVLRQVGPAATRPLARVLKDLRNHENAQPGRDDHAPKREPDAVQIETETTARANSSWKRTLVCLALAGHGVDASPAVGELLVEDMIVRYSTMLALSALGQRVVPEIVTKAQSHNVFHGIDPRIAAESLGYFGSEAEAAIPFLLQAIADDETQAEAPFIALGRIGGETEEILKDYFEAGQRGAWVGLCNLPVGQSQWAADISTKFQKSWVDAFQTRDLNALGGLCSPELALITPDQHLHRRSKNEGNRRFIGEENSELIPGDKIAVLAVRDEEPIDQVASLLKSLFQSRPDTKLTLTHTRTLPLRTGILLHHGGWTLRDKTGRETAGHYSALTGESFVITLHLFTDEPAPIELPRQLREWEDAADRLSEMLSRKDSHPHDYLSVASWFDDWKLATLSQVWLARWHGDKNEETEIWQTALANLESLNESLTERGMTDPWFSTNVRYLKARVQGMLARTDGRSMEAKVFDDIAVREAVQLCTLARKYAVQGKATLQEVCEANAELVSSTLTASTSGGVRQAKLTEQALYTNSIDECCGRRGIDCYGAFYNDEIQLRAWLQHSRVFDDHLKQLPVESYTDAVAFATTSSRIRWTQFLQGKSTLSFAAHDLLLRVDAKRLLARRMNDPILEIEALAERTAFLHDACEQASDDRTKACARCFFAIAEMERRLVLSAHARQSLTAAETRVLDAIRHAGKQPRFFHALPLIEW